MKITKKMSPILFGLVAVLVGCSMMGAAISVIVSTAPTPSVATVTIADAISMSKADTDSSTMGLWAQNYPYLGDAVTPAVGATYDINITASSTAALQNVVFYFKVTKTDVDGTTPVLINPTDLVVKEFQENISASHWIPLDLESYGDYVLGTFAVADTYPETANGVSVTAGWSDSWAFMVQFTTVGVYTFEWYAASPSSPTAVA
jgi:hypothetical protein